MSTTDADQISKFLKDCNLLEFKEKLKEEGVTRVEDIEDLTEEAWVDFNPSCKIKKKVCSSPKSR